MARSTCRSMLRRATEALQTAFKTAAARGNPETTPSHLLLALVEQLNNDPEIHGILVQLPLPDHLDEQTITQSILPNKDVDGFHFINIGKLTSGNTADAFVPCTPAGCRML